LSRDITLGDNEPWDAADDFGYIPCDDAAVEPQSTAAAPSVLDRSIVLPVAAGRWIAATIAVSIGLLLRFIGLDRWPFTVGEANIAQAAYRLIHGESTSAHLQGAPFTIDWTALFFFAGSDLDSVARLSMAVAGVLALLVILGMWRWLGGYTATAAALMAAASPTLIAASRRIEGDALYVALTLIVVVSVLLARERPGIAWPVVAGAASAALWMTGPLGIPAVLLAWFAVVLLARPTGLPSTDALVAGLASAIGTLVLTTTAFLTRPGSFSASIAENVERFWNHHLSQVGSSAHLPAFNLLLNEPLLIILAVVGVVTASDRAIVRATGVWFLTAFVVMSLLGDVQTAGYALITLPLVLLAGTGLAHVVQRIPWHAFRSGTAVVYVIAILLMALAVTSLLGLLIGGTGDDTGEWLLKFALIILVGVLPLSLTISSVGSRVAGSRLVLLLVALLVVSSMLTVHSSVLAASERPGEPGDPLSDGASGADIPIVIERLERVSRDMTMAQRTSQDPTGGHGLHISIDESIEQPFAWYFRYYPNLSMFNPDTESVPPLSDIVLLGETRDSKLVAAGFTGQNYPYQRDAATVLADPNWGDLLGGVVDPNDWRRFAEYMLYREPATDPEEHTFQLLATGEVASRLFPSAGPYTLADRPGPGAAPGQLSQPRGVVVSPDGSTYVVDSRNSRIQKFASTGEFLLEFGGNGSGEGQLGRFASAGGGGANGIAVGSDGNVYVADTWNHRIVVFSPDGAFLRAWGQFFDAADDPAASQTNAGMFYGPRGITAFGGQIYVTDTGNERVQVFAEDGTFIRALGTPGDGDNQLREPVGIAVATDGTIHVADSHNARIARFSADGEWLEPWVVEQWAEQQFFEPYLAIGPSGSTYATTSTAGTVAVFSTDGVAGAPIGGQELRQPFGITVSLDGGALLVTDGSIHAVVMVPIPEP